MKAQRGVVSLYSFFNLGASWSVLLRGKKPGTPCIGRYVDRIAGLDGCKAFDPRIVQSVASRFTD